MQELLAETQFRLFADETSTLAQSFTRYDLEAIMPDLMEELKQLARETRKEVIREASVEERLEGLPAEERLKGLPAEERLKGISPKDLLAALSPEARKALAEELKNEAKSEPESK